MIPVTKSFLPPREEYNHYLDKVWESQWLTNMGPLAKTLEQQLSEHLKLEHLLFVTNGTVALQMAIKALDLKGEIITTPFSFVATTSSIVWEGCQPVFADIDENSLNIDPSKIEAAITPNTSAILATHVYGNPCDVVAIQQIADKHNLKVIYDGAHAFGIEVNGKSVYDYGDISICSLHATKLYHSGEGGLLATPHAEIAKKLAYMRNFGFDGPEAFAELGINGKNSEFHAAMGLTNLKYIDQIHQKRKELTACYEEHLAAVPGFRPQWHAEANLNYAYLPFVFETEALMKNCLKKLNENDIFPRRYFYPSLAKVLPYLKPDPERSRRMPVTEDIASRVLCLPLYYDLKLEEVEMICKVVKQEK